ncbi:MULTISPECIES: siderophore-interacting protein [Nocardiopsis]|uniref:NADPH-dependent ferric siderophore reductase n=1 Tax=Nocardiopsis sinuspersici TaxID=501010 RepID=A0A1V3BYL9_9ACTN|nr:MULTISPECIES: siderophore-interacting protein [Nocardiopsis]OOC53548.1 NADPH-dependent ferric siderophore reductase [Nocardiopsis sinuspersici]
MRIEQPGRRAMIRTRVVRTERLSEHFVTVTLGGPELAGFDFLGRDQFVRLFLPREGQDRLSMPADADKRWVEQLYAMPPSRRPHVRSYSVRRLDADALEMDIEFVDHGDAGPASAWASRAVPGDEAGMLADGVYHLPSEDADWQLLVGDESAVPALVSILEQAPEDMRALVYLEVPSAGDVRPLPDRPGVEVHWLPRTDPHAVPGRLALDTVRAAELPGGRPYCFVAGENALPTELRRTLVREHGVPKEDVSFIGYWRHGRSAMD